MIINTAVLCCVVLCLSVQPRLCEIAGCEVRSEVELRRGGGRAVWGFRSSDGGRGGAEVVGADAHLGRGGGVHRVRGGVAGGGAPPQVPRPRESHIVHTHLRFEFLELFLWSFSLRSLVILVLRVWSSEECARSFQ